VKADDGQQSAAAAGPEEHIGATAQDAAAADATEDDLPADEDGEMLYL